MDNNVSIFWFRRDLRLDDNAGLYHALRSGNIVLPIFIFDTNILDDIADKYDRRVDFILQALQTIQTQLLEIGSSLKVMYGDPISCLEKLCKEYHIVSIYTNHDYEPYATLRDAKVAEILLEKCISFHTYKDQVIFEKNEILKADNTPYTVYTPYSKKWKEKLNPFYLLPYPTAQYFSSFFKTQTIPIPELTDIGFLKSGLKFSTPVLDETIAINYNKTRDYPAIQGTTKLSVHLRFGTISIRQLAQQCLLLNEKLLNELIWREFYQMILWQFPHVVNQSFKREYDSIEWRNNETEFEKWCNGETGYPIVDAGMRELNATGFMHNRVRMITASFLTKHLLIDWRWGEAYFAKKLLDYDLASNNGGWQWAAGSGCDAAPYFRIFNPYIQTQKFDPNTLYISKWVSDYQDFSYPKPIIEHSSARDRCLKLYKSALTIS
ncbi:MAG: deoxyribodipyrimidine photo-lyase [Bacteroidota bacterium]